MAIETARPADGRTPSPRMVVALPVEGMTCHSCVRRVQSVLDGTPGVSHVRVDLPGAQAIMDVYPGQVAWDYVRVALEAVGYECGTPVPLERTTTVSEGTKDAGTAQGNSVHLLPGAAGIVASAALLGLTAGLVTLAQGFDHATELLLGDWYLVLPIVAGFGIQVGLFVEMRRRLRRREGTRQATAVTGASTGTSGVAMVACCAHHLADVLPFLGLSGAALLLAEYRQPMMVLGLAMNLVGITMMVRMLRRTSRSHT